MRDKKNIYTYENITVLCVVKSFSFKSKNKPKIQDDYLNQKSKIKNNAFVFSTRLHKTIALYTCLKVNSRPLCVLCSTLVG